MGGKYIQNTATQTKEQFLSKHGKKIHAECALEMFTNPEWKGRWLPVCLVYNFSFTAAGIATDEAECKRFLSSALDGREYTWYMVPVLDLAPWMPQGEAH